MLVTSIRCLIKSIVIVFCFKYVSGRRVREYEELVTVLPAFVVSKMGPLHEIPMSFDVRGDPQQTFKQYVEEIERLAKKKDLEVAYKVIVETRKPNIKFYGLNTLKRTRPKQHNVPIKKKVGLAQFEKASPLFGVAGTESTNEILRTTTEEIIGYYGISTKSIRYKKYKPDISPLRLRFKKISRPIKDRVFTFDS